MRKIKLGAASFWTILMGFISPIWIGSTYMDLTGYSKGYSYDRGSEDEIAVVFGFIMLMIWLVAVIPVIVFTLCFIASVLLIGMDEFLKIFTYPFSAFYH